MISLTNGKGASLSQVNFHEHEHLVDSWIGINVKPEHYVHVKNFLKSPLQHKLPDGLSMHDMIRFG